MNFHPKITTIILTFNEEIHIERCINSVKEISNQVIIIDSYSTDQTIKISESNGATVYQNKFINQAIQFQWALNNCKIDGEWIIRLDADEYFTQDLVNEIIQKLPTIQNNYTGIYLNRRVHFMGKWIRFGGFYPIKLLRIWKKDAGSIEQKWMDEHVKLSYGLTLEFENDFIDENLQNLSWWIQKHNNYAIREAIEYLNEKYNLYEKDSIDLNSKSQEVLKRKVKVNFYNKLPLFFRAFFYFNFRYLIKLGFLDGQNGLMWHLLQGLWYRFLVDCKIFELEYLSKKNKKPIRVILFEEYGIEL